MSILLKNNFIRISTARKMSAGFTLIELLIAAFLTTIVVSVAGTGLVTIMGSNTKAQAETERRVNLNRALDFISDEIRMAIKVNKSDSAPSWAWTNLDGGSAELYLQIPSEIVKSETVSVDDKITIGNPAFKNGNAVMFTGAGTIAGLEKNKKYYVTNVDLNTFKISDTVGGTPKDLTPSSGLLTINKLVIYYTNASTNTWLGPKTINRSTGDCSTTSPINCSVLIDSIAATNGIKADITSDFRKADIKLSGILNDNSTKTFNVSSKAFGRPFDKATKDVKDAKDAKDKADQAASTAKVAADNAKTLQDAADKAAIDYDKAKVIATDKAKDAQVAAAKAATDKTAAVQTTAAQAAAAQAEAERIAAQKAEAKEIAAEKAKAAQDAAAKTAAEEAKAERIAAQYEQQYTAAAEAAEQRAAAAQVQAEQDAAAQTAADQAVATHTAAAQAADRAANTYNTAAVTAQTAADLANAQRITTNAGTVTFTQASNLFVEVLGGSITCGSPGPEIPTTTTINITNMSPKTLTSSTKSLNVSVPAGSKLTVTGAAKGNSSSGSCQNFSSSYNSATNTITGSNATNPPQQVWTLRNGETPPAFRPYGAQRAIDAFLTKYLDPITGKVSIRANQVIFLYELGTTSRNTDAYDLQDLVVLATISAN